MAVSGFGLIETSLVEGAALVWACWELWSVRKSKVDKDVSKPLLEDGAPQPETETGSEKQIPDKLL